MYRTDALEAAGRRGSSCFWRKAAVCWLKGERYCVGDVGGDVEIVRSIYEAFNRREWDAVFRDTAPDVELTTPPGGPNSGTYRGREEVRKLEN